MTRGRIIAAIVTAVLLLLVVWVANNTYWEDLNVPAPMKGAALTNPFFAAQRFADALGVTNAWDRVLTLPRHDAVIVLSGFHWNLSARRREALEGWVQAGGRLVVDRTLVGGEEFARWSGIATTIQMPAKDERPEAAEHEEETEEETAASASNSEPCRILTEPSGAAPSVVEPIQVCGIFPFVALKPKASPAWSLVDEAGLTHAARAAVGRGSVTVVNADPFRRRALLDGDHARLLAVAAQLRRGDEIRFLSEDDHPSLLAVTWARGGAAVVVGLALLALLLWRGAVRFGPPAPPQHQARRSLAEQIRGTGRFALRHGGGDALHAAAVRALEEAARRRVPAYTRLPARERAAALARLTGFERDALAAAIYHPGLRRPAELRGTLATLEEARRRTLTEHTGSRHGTS